MKNKSTALRAAALACGLILLFGGAFLSAAAVMPAAKTRQAADEYAASAYDRGADDKYDYKYNGYPVLVHGDITSDEGGAEDPFFGVSADTLLLVRKSEMFQWVPDGKGGFVTEWREDIIDTGDGEHRNPSEYPLNTGSAYFSAHTVRLCGYRVKDEQLACLTSREKIKELPEGEVRGFRADGEYMTNSKDPSSPEPGDVRVSFEYVTSKTMTLAGLHRSEAVEAWRASNGVSVYGVYEGEISSRSAAEAWADGADGVIIWLLPLGIAASLLGGAASVLLLSRLISYDPSLRVPFGKKKLSLKGMRAALTYGVLLGVLSACVGISAAWARAGALPLLAALVLSVVFLYLFIPNVIRNTPRRQKKEAPYEPILKKRDEFGKR